MEAMCQETLDERHTPRSVNLEQRHSIFLSHSRAQKTFVRRLSHTLERNAYHPFFDEHPESLPKGEPFVERILAAVQQVNVAVVVLSDDFLKSKWPMIELSLFVAEQSKRKSTGCKELKILPLFMGFSVDEFRCPERRLTWRKEWDELAARDTRIKTSKWIKALGILGRTNGIEYRHYSTEDAYIGSIVCAIFKLVSPDVKWEDSYVKGKSKFYQALIEMFAKSTPARRWNSLHVIGLYGMGGMGKTTICKALCNDYFARFDGKVWHAELGSKNAMEIQKDVLRELAGTGDVLLNNASVKSKDQWQGLLRRRIGHKVFLAIDNVWNEAESREQAEALLDMGFHPESLVIVTSRSRQLLEWLGVESDSCFEMPQLDKDDATSLFLHYAAPGFVFESFTDQERRTINKAVERCLLNKGVISWEGSTEHYVPLALKVLGSQARSLLRDNSSDWSKWMKKLDFKRSQQQSHPIFSILGLSFDNLPSLKHKSIFLDIALCAPRQRDNTSASVRTVCKWLSLVYEEDDDDISIFLEELQRDALLERWTDPTSPLGIHELYCEFAKGEAMKEDSVSQLYLYHEDGRDVPALLRRFPQGSCWPLRRICIYNGGFRGLSNKELHYLLNVEILKLDFCLELESLDLRCLKNLRSLELRGCFQLTKVTGLEDLHDLVYFRWNTCNQFPLLGNLEPDITFPMSLRIVEIFGSKASLLHDFTPLNICRNLRELTLSTFPCLLHFPNLLHFEALEEVNFSGCRTIGGDAPDIVGASVLRGLESLHRLKDLNLSNCTTLTVSGDCVSTALQNLNLLNCKRLRSWQGLETLVRLQTLNMKDCKRLRLPRICDLSKLIKLRILNMGGLTSLQELVLGSPDLVEIELEGCILLVKVTMSAENGSWRILNRLNIMDCHSLEIFPFADDPISDLSIFQKNLEVQLCGCSALTWLPNLHSFENYAILDLSNCGRLENLAHIGPLRALQSLVLKGCSSLRVMPDLRYSPLLEEVNLEGCLRLTALSPLNLKHAMGLHLNISNCSALENFSNLQELHGCLNLRLAIILNRNSTSETADIVCLSAIQTLKVSYMKIDHIVYPPSLGVQDLASVSPFIDLEGCLQLEELELRHCTIPRFFINVRHLTRLQSLILEACEMLTELPPLKDWNYATIRQLNIRYCHNLQDLSNARPLCALQSLSIKSCNSLGALPDLSLSTALQSLHLEGLRNIILRDLSSIGQLTTLTKFHLFECEGILLPVFKPRNLTELDIRRCRRLEGLAHWGPLSSLRFLSIFHCDMITHIPNLQASSNLEYLCLDNCACLCGFIDIGPSKVFRRIIFADCEKITGFSDSFNCREAADILSIFNCPHLVN